MASSSVFLVFFLIILGIAIMPHGILAAETVEYVYSVANNVPNTAGGARFDREIGATYTLQAMSEASSFIWTILQQNNLADRKDVRTVPLYIDDFDGVAYASEDKIHVAARYIEGITGNVLREFKGIVYHEMVHVRQWSGGPTGPVEGIADYVNIKAGNPVGPGRGDKWDAGYDTTARFFVYCDGLRNGFVAELNKKMRNGYNDSYFVDLLGKPVEQLWEDYKATWTG